MKRSFQLAAPLVAVALGAGLTSSAEAGVPNDECADAIEIFLGDTPYSTLGASTSAPAWTCALGGIDIWFSFEATYTGTLALSTCDQADYDSALAVYTDCAGTLVACLDDTAGCSVNTQILLVEVNLGTTYLIRVGGFSSSSGTGTLTLTDDVPIGACCLSDGFCFETLEDICAVNGGSFQGEGTLCDSVDCLELVGACCLPDGFCIATFEDICLGAEGFFQGQGVACNEIVCGGACCFPDGTCIETFEDFCIGSGGLYQGDEIPCSEIVCGGACCLPDGTCIETFEDVCLNAGGLYQGDDVPCESVVCTGACCLPDGTCVDGVSQAVCEAGASECGNCDSGGNGIGCSDPACEAIVCGMDPFCCSIAWDSICDGEAIDFCDNCGPGGLGGVFAGLGTTCPRLSLEVDGTCLNADKITVELWARGLDSCSPATGSQAFIAYDPATLAFATDNSFYIDDFFPTHITSIEDAEGDTGFLQLDGAGPFPDPTPVDHDVLVAVLSFDVLVQCELTTVDFDLGFPFDSELSLDGFPIGTNLVNTIPFYADFTPPDITCPDDVTIECDEDSSPENTGSATATDNCEIPFEDPLGACCLPDGSCLDAIDPLACINANGWFMGFGTACDDVVCPADPLGACCLPDGTCLDGLTWLECVGGFFGPPGAFQGPGTTCADAVCPAEPLGACCLFDGTCIDAIDPISCILDPFFGLFQGFGTTCADVVCAGGQPDVDFFDEENLDGCGGTGTITRTWTATDACGRQSSCVQTITVVDTTAPEIDGCPDDIVVDADAGGCDAQVSWTEPTASDNCALDSFTSTHSPGDIFGLGVTIVTYTAADECGNDIECVFTVEVLPFTEAAIDIELVGSIAATRCVRIVLLDCDSGDSSDPIDVFVDVDDNGLGTAELDLPCGAWTHVCVKDEKHTKWGTAPLLVDGLTFVSDGFVVCLPGDNDNDSDVDINDVTLLLAQFGGPEPGDNGACPWDTIRGADYSNNGNVGATDYSLLSANWLTSTSCGCPTAEAPVDLPTSVPVTAFAPAIAARADLDGNGVIDFRDVQIFERRKGLPPLLSEQIRLSQQEQRR